MSMSVREVFPLPIYSAKTVFTNRIEGINFQFCLEFRQSRPFSFCVMLVRPTEPTYLIVSPREIRFLRQGQPKLVDGLPVLALLGEGFCQNLVHAIGFGRDLNNSLKI